MRRGEERREREAKERGEKERGEKKGGGYTLNLTELFSSKLTFTASASTSGLIDRLPGVAEYFCIKKKLINKRFAKIRNNKEKKTKKKMFCLFSRVYFLC